ncbi:MAG TPA: SDR family oxidoreductase [Thermoanaerobaculia bacterium]|jgi:NADP-dependent 3-hydroxy acid dehydrogenase YdfG|nr:SDR family oxidoreductase [Thermoanaerobaculia bacterium]
MIDLRGQTALINGATGGIGAAVAEALMKEGVRLILVGRDAERLKDLSTRTHAEIIQADLTDDTQLLGVAAKVGEVDLLIHSIGLFRGGPLETAPVQDLDDQYRVNVRVPYLLTQALLPSLIRRQGQVVFVNSGAGAAPARGSWGAYAATKHALRALADALRVEVNPKGVRVLTVFPGRTATAMQEEVHRFEGQPYDPDRFLQPEDVAAPLVQALRLPRTAELTDLHIRPMKA